VSLTPFFSIILQDLKTHLIADLITSRQQFFSSN
jgi:hypothetical protein